MPAPEPGQRWGLLGGTFDPVHNGHLSLARDAYEHLHLDGVFFVPARHHPLKSGTIIASFKDRQEMLRLALSGQADFAINSVEETQNLSGYTIDTVVYLKKSYPEVEFFFIVGADNLAILHEWKQIDAILSETILVVGRRPGADLDLPSDLPENRFTVIKSKLVPASATEIRRAIAAGEDTSWTDLVPPAVARYIEQQGLYR